MDKTTSSDYFESIKETNKQITPSEYFEKLKNSKHTLTSEKIKESYEVILKLAEKYKTTGQEKSLERLRFLTEVLGEEEKLIPLGVTTFIYRSTIEDYINDVAQDVVKVIEVKNYIREIPDEIVEVIEKTKNIFNEFYIVFTDYTGREERRVAQERKDKDPILFGCFRNSSFTADRFYFLGDWQDEYCDLTLDKLVSEYKTKKKVLPTHPVISPKTSEEVLEIIGRYEEKKDEINLFVNKPLPIDYIPKKSFFQKIKSIFNK